MFFILAKSKDKKKRRTTASVSTRQQKVKTTESSQSITIATLNSLSSGAFLRNICIVFDKLGQSEASDGCKAKNMMLLKIDSSEVQDALFDFGQRNFGSRKWVARVDGLRNTADGKWYYDDGTTPAFSGLKWLKSANTPAGDDSLVVANINWRKSGKKLDNPVIDGIPTSENQYPYICQF